MTLKDIFLSGSGALVVILMLIQITPIKVDPFWRSCSVDWSCAEW